jgi:hypothetical protein
VSPASGSVSLFSKLNVLNTDTLSPFDLASQMNTAFIEPMQNVQALQSPSSCEFQSTPDALSVIEFDVFRALKNLSTSKASVSDGIPNWMLREYAAILAYQITSILNRSFTEQKLPHSWKLADIVPIPKQQLIDDISKHQPPFSLTISISKLAEEFVVTAHVGPAVQKRYQY